MKRNEEYVDSCYNRDLSWTLFNRRVINLATETVTPFLEKLKFLAIGSNNLDEFYSVRVPSIQSQMELSDNGVEKKSGLHYSQILNQIHTRNNENFQIQYHDYDKLNRELKEKDICSIKSYEDLDDKQKNKANQYFIKNIQPELAFKEFDKNYTLKFLSNKQIAIGVLVEGDDKKVIRIIPVPLKFDRLVPVKSNGIDTYILLEDLINHNLKRLFNGKEITGTVVFRVTRDLDATLDVEKEDNNFETISRMRQYLVDREKGKVTRFEVEEFDGNTDDDFLRDFISKFNLGEDAIFKIPGPVDLTYLFEIVSKYSPDYPEYCYAKFNPRTWSDSESMLAYLDQKDLLIQYPYDSFSQFLQFLKEAVESPKTVAIKQTLYRVSKHSEVVDLLAKAAQKGIKTTVVVELRARFDEKNNLKVTEKLKNAGVHVIFGKQDMKVHSKTCLVLTKEGEHPQGYIQVGTGNYNMQTAKGFVDLSFFTSKDDYVRDLSKFFDYLQAPDAAQPSYQVLSASPHQIQDQVIDGIQEVKESYLKTGKGAVFLKINSLTDVEVISAIYDAARVGVPFRLVVRGACCLKLGICGKKEKIVVSSIVGEFLEHSRIYGFFTNDDSKLWISSADLMTRNMDNRVELAAPILDPKLKKQLLNIIDIYAQDDVDGSFLKPDGQYFKFKHPKGKSAQQTFLKIIDDPKLNNKKHISKRHDIRINVKNGSNLKNDWTYISILVVTIIVVVAILLWW
ncbi:polyphosphate kinase 1 [Fructilactobacillus fructivorans]|uniref:Polyphosphate kinase n=1 Tax=Fructilactobacillus fructivorans TaxID=1614 RepID=A0A0C1LYS8_9LACO|nr:polyphosphate kinase 1 [Fructilactobacillus fructivorans]KID42050.1 Polyphosphate kinase [Fructilactobacillus fructivorans]MCT0151705.1 polyphosphate kinase 1 [Fructilactobacillus fructivorans]MCT2867166.1 polyphosphate kinase 1 [Fructilactobacillus fructivorans]MCT2868273.1 polyphosphate kinase 1 [Fructilactobacillus fructivorans]MCT2872981.1 polyphosphate kinase 1 [Fructilactobacillus fructivorans]